MNEIETTVWGVQVQHDGSGVGHNWRNIDASDIPADIRAEIEAAMDDPNADEHNYVASNGLHYRW